MLCPEHEQTFKPYRYILTAAYGIVKQLAEDPYFWYLCTGLFYVSSENGFHNGIGYYNFPGDLHSPSWSVLRIRP